MLKRFSETGLDTKLVPAGCLGGANFSLRIPFEAQGIRSIAAGPPADANYQAIGAFRLDGPMLGRACGPMALYTLNTGVSRAAFFLRASVSTNGFPSGATQPEIYFQVRSVLGLASEVVWTGSRGPVSWDEDSGLIVQITGRLGDGFEIWACVVSAVATSVDLSVDVIADRESGPNPVEVGRFVTSTFP